MGDGGARWDLNPGFSAPEADALSVLDYEPTAYKPNITVNLKLTTLFLD